MSEFNFEYDNYSLITNAVVNIKANVCPHLFESLHEMREKLNTQFILVNISNLEENKLVTVINYLNASSYLDIEYYLDYDSLSIANWDTLITKITKSRKVIIHNVKNKVINFRRDMVQIVNEEIKLNSCGIVNELLFNNNIEHFTESQHHNTCLNRKISIDANGEIKNCPSMAKSWGNIKDTKLIDVVNNPEFQQLWHIKKDDITKCKDCEFRHICTDCRAYTDNPDDLYAAPLKCGYDPYTGVWEEWSTNPLKQQAIAFYGMQDLVKKQ
jgi:SPASM domain peptide maturase of grasp-with-spasm system